MLDHRTLLFPFQCRKRKPMKRGLKMGGYKFQSFLVFPVRIKCSTRHCFPGKIGLKREIKLWHLKVSTEFSGENKQNSLLCKYCLQKQMSSKIITKTDGRCTFFLEYEREIMSFRSSPHCHHIKCLVNQASNISFCA